MIAVILFHIARICFIFKVNDSNSLEPHLFGAFYVLHKVSLKYKMFLKSYFQIHKCNIKFGSLLNHQLANCVRVYVFPSVLPSWCYCHSLICFELAFNNLSCKHSVSGYFILYVEVFHEENWIYSLMNCIVCLLFKCIFFFITLKGDGKGLMTDNM